MSSLYYILYTTRHICHLSILVVRRVKAVQEFAEYLVFGPFPVLVLGVVFGVVDAPEVVDRDHAVARLIQFPKGLHNHPLS